MAYQHAYRNFGQLMREERVEQGGKGCYSYDDERSMPSLVIVLWSKENS